MNILKLLVVLLIKMEKFNGIAYVKTVMNIVLKVATK